MQPKLAGGAIACHRATLFLLCFGIIVRRAGSPFWRVHFLGIFFFAGGVPSKARKEGRNAGREKGRKKGRRKKEARKEGRKIRRNEMRTPQGRKECQEKGRKEERKEGRNPPQSRFKYLRTSRDRTHMDPFRTRDKGVCKSGGLHPAQPPRFSMPCRLVFKTQNP